MASALPDVAPRAWHRPDAPYQRDPWTCRSCIEYGALRSSSFRDQLELLCGVSDRPHHVLFLCTGNSARSILAEALLNRLGKGRFQGFSAGSHPKGAVHPLALELLRQEGLPTAGLRSKSWEEFAAAGAPALDFIVTVCDNAAGEMCPVWPGKPTSAHWGIPDPAAVEGSEEERRHAFRVALQALAARIQLFVVLPIAALDGQALKLAMREIGHTSL